MFIKRLFKKASFCLILLVIVTTMLLAFPLAVLAAGARPEVAGLSGDSVTVQAGDTVGIDDGGNAVVTDTDSPHFNGGYLQILYTAGTADGSFSVDATAVTSGGNAAMAAGETVAVGGVDIGTVNGVNDGQGGHDFVIDFTSADATPARVSTLIQNLRYMAPTAGVRSFSLLTNDSSMTQLIPSLFTVTVTALGITARFPAINAQNIFPDVGIWAQFDADIDLATVTQNTFNVDGSLSGHIGGSYAFFNGNDTVQFTPDHIFAIGETITVTLTTGLLDAGGAHLGRSVTWQFTVDAPYGSGEFDSQSCFGDVCDPTESIALGDVNGDGIPDGVVGNAWESNVIYISDGDGSFDTTSHDFGTDADITTGLALGDMDGDGDLDIVTGSYQQQNVVYLNDGDGSFDTTSHNFGTGTDVTMSVALGDVDGDGALDIVTGNIGQNVVYLNDGAGSFPTGNNFGTGADNTFTVALGDMDGDGALDIVTGNYQQQNVVYLNNGAGSFTAGNDFGPDDNNSRSVALGDVDGDSDLDIAVGNDGQQNVVYLNDGAGSFPAGNNFGTGNDSTYSVALGDMDSDNDLDIVVGNIGQNVVYFNDGDGTFDTTSKNFGPDDNNSRSIALGDVDDDDALDIAVAVYGNLNFCHRNDLPEIEVMQDATPIADGGAYDFGSQAPNTNTDVIFTIQNWGSSTLTLTTPLVTGGANADQFSLQTQPASPVAATGGTTTFTVRFTPTTAGAKTATISIANNDSDENPYDITLNGTGAAAPAPVGGGGMPYSYSPTNMLGGSQRLITDDTGRVMKTVEATDGTVTLTIPEGTVMKSADGKALHSLNAAVNPNHPSPPKGKQIIALPYDFEPDGATFDPPLILTYTYDPANLPEGVAEEDLVLAFFNEETGEWVELECTVDTVNHIITARIYHFTTYAVMAPLVPEPTPEPAPAPTSTPPITPEATVTPAPEPALEPPPTPVIVPALTVTPPASVTPAPTPAAAPAPTPTNWPLIWWIAGGVIIAGLAVFFIARQLAWRKHGG